MAATCVWYSPAITDQWGTTAADRIDFVTDTIKATQHTSAYTVNQDTDRYFTAATNELATAGGYTAGGQTLVGKTLTYDAPTNTTRFKATDLTWTAASFTARKMVIRKDTGVAGTSHLMGVVDYGADQNPVAVDFVVKGDATDGFLRGVTA